VDHGIHASEHVDGVTEVRQVTSQVPEVLA
jgi:hypothetical protein